MINKRRKARAVAYLPIYLKAKIRTEAKRRMLSQSEIIKMALERGLTWLERQPLETDPEYQKELQKERQEEEQKRIEECHEKYQQKKEPNIIINQDGHFVPISPTWDEDLKETIEIANKIWNGEDND